jgi:tryptophan halogenase
MSARWRSPTAWRARSTCSPAGDGIFQSDYDLFAEPSWIAVLLGQGIVPRQYDALVDALPAAALVHRLKRMADLIGQTAQAMPDHQAFIARYCAADLAAANTSVLRPA